MNNKVNIDFLFPLIEKKINIDVPINKSLGEVLLKLFDDDSFEEIGNYKDKTDLVLINKSTGESEDINLIIDKLKLKNGFEIIII